MSLTNSMESSGEASRWKIAGFYVRDFLLEQNG
jgi:hypothetical protein